MRNATVLVRRDVILVKMKICPAGRIAYRFRVFRLSYPSQNKFCASAEYLPGAYTENNYQKPIFSPTFVKNPFE